jgi:hypothetical protein
MENETFNRKGGFPAISAVKPVNPVGVRAVACLGPSVMLVVERRLL